MKKILCFLFIGLLVSFILIINASASNENMEEISLIEYDCITGEEREFVVEYDPSLIESAGNPHLYSLANSPRQIVGEDNRNLVYWADYYNYPYSAIGMISYEKNGSFYVSSAFTVADRVILTSAHSAYNVETDSWAINCFYAPHIFAMPTRDYIIQNGYYVIRIIFPSAYKTNPSADNDWAIMVVNQDIGSKDGIYSQLALTTSPPSPSASIYVIGYDSSGTMYSSPGNIISCNANNIVYSCDTTSNNSGSPVLYYNGTSYSVFAIHTGTYGSNNIGCRIIQYVIDSVIEISAEYD